MERRFHEIPPPPEPQQETPQEPSVARSVFLVGLLISLMTFVIAFFGHGVVNLFVWAWNLWPW